MMLFFSLQYEIVRSFYSPHNDETNATKTHQQIVINSNIREMICGTGDDDDAIQIKPARLHTMHISHAK